MGYQNVSPADFHMVTIKETGLILAREKVRNNWITDRQLNHGCLFHNNQKKLYLKAHRIHFQKKSS